MFDLLMNKKVLLIVPKFYGYDDIIASRMRQLGAVVYKVYEDMDEVNYYYRFINAYFHNQMPKVMNKYFFRHILPIAESLDYVFLIRGEFLNPEVLEILKSKTPTKCKYCMYQWDSVKNNPNAIRICSYFDSVSTFDPIDSEKYTWNYRPLFYIPEFVHKVTCDIDILYLCSLHSNRIKVLNRLKELCKTNKLNLFSRVYSKKLIFYKRKYLNKREGYIIADNSDISSKKMNLKDTYGYYNRSKIVIDYTHPGQNGLTMRTIEAFGCGKKLVTNNQHILQEDFYDPDNIFVYSGEDIDIPTDFFNSTYRNPDKRTYLKYSIDSWLSAVLI